MTTTAVSSSTQPITAFTPCAWVSDICQKIYDVAMKIIQAIKDCFAGGANSLSVTTTTTTTMASGSRNLIAFYRGLEANNNQATLEQILNWDDNNLEQVHNYIQWLFPLETPSGPNPTAPVLDQVTIQAFRQDPALKAQVLRSFHRMLAFYGLQWNEPARVISRTPNFNARAAVWLTPANHNFLRITRMIHSLCLLGLLEQGRALLTIMEHIAGNEGAATVSPATLQFWRGAAVTRTA
jgi:hypothetical protein